MFGEEGNDNIVCNDAGPSNRDLHYVVGGAGDDHIWGCSDDSRRDRIWGDDPSDPTIQGADRIDTGKGPDHVDGGPLSDEICVGDVALATFSNGTMTIIGGLGADYIQLKSAWGFVYRDRVGDAVNGDADTIDVLGGHASKGYRMWLGGGNDQILNGGPGNDQIYGENGSDISLRGGEGNDGISGGEGSDDILGGNGEDFLVGDDGSDIIDGKDMADKLYDFSSQYVDTLRGGDGDDRLFCNDNQQQNPDFNFGEAGNDTFEFDDIDAVVPQTDALSPPESTIVLPPTPDIIVALQVVVGW